MKPFEFWLGGWFAWALIGGAAGTLIGGTGTAGVVGGLLGTAAGSLLGRKKAAKQVPIEEIDLQEQQSQAVAGNLANADSIEALISRGNAFNANQATSLAEQTMPGFGELQKTLTSRATALAENPYDVPEEVQKNLERIAAERGISAGTRGQFNDFSLLRDFGVESLKYGRENLNQSQQIAGVLSAIAPKVNPMSPLSFYVTPGGQAQQSGINASNRQFTQQAGVNEATNVRNENNSNLWGDLQRIAGIFSAQKSGGGGGPTIDTSGLG